MSRNPEFGVNQEDQTQTEQGGWSVTVTRRILLAGDENGRSTAGMDGSLRPEVRRVRSPPMHGPGDDHCLPNHYYGPADDPSPDHSAGDHGAAHDHGPACPNYATGDSLIR